MVIGLKSVEILQSIPNSHRIKEYLILRHQNPPPPPHISEKQNGITPISGFCYHWKLQKHPFTGLYRELFPRLYPQIPPHLQRKWEHLCGPHSSAGGGGGLTLQPCICMVDLQVTLPFSNQSITVWTFKTN